MNVNEIITETLIGFGDPIVPDMYTGDRERYFTFNYDTVPMGFADDAPDFERVLVQVHFFCPYNYNSVSRRKEIKKKLFAAGFTYPDESNVTMTYGSARDDSQHFVFECEFAEEVELDG